MTRKQFISDVLYALAASDTSTASELTLKEAYDRVNDRANEEEFDDEPKPLYDWDNAPPNATHATTNANRYTVWWASQPTFNGHVWDHGGFISAGKKVTHGLFAKDSLEERPKR